MAYKLTTEEVKMIEATKAAIADGSFDYLEAPIPEYAYKDLDDTDAYIVNTTEPSLCRETEKAICLKFNSKIGRLTLWVPKVSYVYDLETKFSRNHRIEEATSKNQAVFAKYDEIKEWAKAQGIKGICKRIKKITLLKKISAAGLWQSLPDDYKEFLMV